MEIDRFEILQKKWPQLRRYRRSDFYPVYRKKDLVGLILKETNPELHHAEELGTSIQEDLRTRYGISIDSNSVVLCPIKNLMDKRSHNYHSHVRIERSLIGKEVSIYNSHISDSQILSTPDAKHRTKIIDSRIRSSDISDSHLLECQIGPQSVIRNCDMVLETVIGATLHDKKISARKKQHALQQTAVKRWMHKMKSTAVHIFKNSGPRRASPTIPAAPKLEHPTRTIPLGKSERA